MTDAIDYNAEYDNSARVENAGQLINNYISDAAQFRESAVDRSSLNLAYGPGDRNMMDIFWPDTDAVRDQSCPVVLFIHGGYWQRMDRSSFSHLAIGLNANGFAVAMPSYTLCPDISISGIITEMRRACLVLFQTYKKKLTVVGHSAGGHLAACMMATDWEGIHPKLPHDLVASGMGISGLYDLLPLRQTSVNDAVGMDENEAISASPIRWMPEAIQRFEAWVGGDESSEYHRQSRELSERWSLLGTPTNYVSVPFANHFTIVDELTNGESNMVQRLVSLLENPRSDFTPAEVDEKALESVLARFVKEAKNLPDPVEPELPAHADEVATLQSDEPPNVENDAESAPEPEAETAEEQNTDVETEFMHEVKAAEPVDQDATSATDNELSADGEPEQAASADEADTGPQKHTQ